MKYKEPLYRPPSEAESLIFQISYGCPHNTCTFCPMYKTVAYEVRPIDDIISEIRFFSRKFPLTKRIFLADGDVMKLPFTMLFEILLEINKNFANLSRISLYANGSSIMEKNHEQLEILHKLKLHTLYMGLESGDDNLLRLVNKKETSQVMIGAVKEAQQVGFRMCVFILLGLGGKMKTKKHIENTAKVLNEMNPSFLAALRFIKHPLFKMYNEYLPLSEYESVFELREIISKLNLTSCLFRADHSSLPFPVNSRLPSGKNELISSLTEILSGTCLDKNGQGFISHAL